MVIVVDWAAYPNSPIIDINVHRTRSSLLAGSIHKGFVHYVLRERFGTCLLSPPVVLSCPSTNSLTSLSKSGGDDSLAKRAASSFRNSLSSSAVFEISSSSPASLLKRNHDKWLASVAFQVDFLGRCPLDLLFHFQFQPFFKPRTKIPL